MTRKVLSIADETRLEQAWAYLRGARDLDSNPRVLILSAILERIDDLIEVAASRALATGLTPIVAQIPKLLAMVEGLLQSDRSTRGLFLDRELGKGLLEG